MSLQVLADPCLRSLFHIFFFDLSFFLSGVLAFSQMLAEACVPVATHRHGCCVIQRAIDAATVDQSRLLVSQVSKHALQLMQVTKIKGVHPWLMPPNKLLCACAYFI